VIKQMFLCRVSLLNVHKAIPTLSILKRFDIYNQRIFFTLQLDILISFFFSFICNYILWIRLSIINSTIYIELSLSFIPFEHIPSLIADMLFHFNWKRLTILNCFWFFHWRTSFNAAQINLYIRMIHQSKC